MPLALNLYKYRDAKTEDGRFFRSIYKQKSLWQGFWLVSPTGKVLAHHERYKSDKTWTQEVLNTLRDGLKKFGPVSKRNEKPRDLFPYRGKGVRTEGGVKMAISIRWLIRGKPRGNAVLDSLNLTAKDFAAFVPPRRRIGQTWAIPAPVASKFCRCLSPFSDLAWMPSPKDVTAVRLAGRVLDIRNDTVIVTYAGHISAVHQHPFEKKKKLDRGQATIQGVAEYNWKMGQMRAAAFVLEGVFHDFPPWHREARPIAAAVDWQLTK